MDLKQINAELKSLTIAVQNGNFHRRLNSLSKRHDKQTQPVATLLIPNRFFLLYLMSATTFSDVTKQNGRASVGTLYREVLGEVVFPYDSLNSKKGEGEAYSI